MSITYLQAKDEIFGVCNVAFLAAVAASSLLYTPQLVFPSSVVVPPDPTQIDAECHFIVVLERQACMTSVGGVKLYESVGLFSLKVFSPKLDPASLLIAETIASSVRDAFRAQSPSGEIWFKDQRCSVVAGTDTRNQVNVVVTCTYKTAK